MFCRVARLEIEAKRVACWRKGALWRSRAINGTTWTRVIRGLLWLILFAGSTGRGGGSVASPWTKWDGSGEAVVLAVEWG